MRPYRSPFGKFSDDYVNRRAGVPTKRIIHFFRTTSGIVQCQQPALCRECYRETNWKEGQTHG